ncbi:MAG: peptidylprolyl isomerase [Verrucomicrobiota bacterium]
MRLPSLAAMLVLLAGPLPGQFLPVLNNPASVDVLVGDPDTTINLNHVFGMEAIDNSVVRFSSNFSSSGNPLVLDIALFSTRAPVSRSNFLTYVTDGDYLNSVVHRSVPGFIVQGGAHFFNSQSGFVESIPTDPSIPNEFGISNTPQTVAYAKVAGFPNSATSQWFVNMGENGDNLDNQNSGFTVFGRVTQSTFANAQTFNNPGIFPINDLTGILGPNFSDTPVFNSFDGTGLPTLNELIFFTSVSMEPISSADAGQDTNLTFAIESNSDSFFIDDEIINGNILRLGVLDNQTGNATVVVSATDSVGNVVRDSIQISVEDTYERWRNRNFSPADAADDAISGPDADSNGDGYANLIYFSMFRNFDPFSPVPTVVRPRLSTNTRQNGDRHVQFTFNTRNIVPMTIFLQKATTLGDWKDVLYDSAVIGTGQGSDAPIVRIEAVEPIEEPCQYRVKWVLNES